MDYERLSRTIAHALRHEPWVYELEIDDEGWVPVGQLVHALRRHRPQWRGLDRSDLERMMERAGKRRYEIRDGRIRALYGHSLPGKLEKEPARPPDRLWHGTAPSSAPEIREEGLRPMGRQYVHLSVDRPTARQVGRRKCRSPTLFRVRAAEAHGSGVSFYEGNEKVWLADRVPPKFLEER